MRSYKLFALPSVWKPVVALALLAASCLSVQGGTAWAAAWQALASPYPDASGSEHNPIVISTPRQLAHFALQVSEGSSFEGMFVELKNNINMSGRLWTPIGNREEDSVRFNGRFDGKGYTISGLTIRGSNEDYHGLFGALESNAVVCDLNLTNINVTADGKSLGVGGLAGYNAGRVENITASGTVKGIQSVGGLVGRNFGSVLNIRSTVRVTGSGMNVGELVGYNDFKKGVLSGMEMSR